MAKKFYCYLFKVKSNRVLLGLCIAVLAFVAASCNNSAKKNSQMAAVGDSIVSDTEDSLVFVTLRDSVLKDSAYTHSLTFQFPVSGSKDVREYWTVSIRKTFIFLSQYRYDKRCRGSCSHLSR